MDEECVVLLPQVCAVLADPRKSVTLPDDTTLEKLLDWLTELISTDKRFTENYPCLLEFLSTVMKQESSDPSVLSFALKLTGLLAASKEGFRLLQEGGFLRPAFSYQRWLEVGVWEDPCLRIGWIQGLRTMMQHKMALHFLVHTEIIKPLLQLQTDPSLFVASAANQLLAHLLVFFQPVISQKGNGVAREEEEEEKKGKDASVQTPIAMDTSTEQLDIYMRTSPEHVSVTMEVLQHLEMSLVFQKGEDLPKTLQSLRMLVLLLSQARPPLWDTLMRKVPRSLEALVTAECRQLTQPLMDVLLTAYKHPASDCLPDRTVSRLLSTMLDTQNPWDLIQAAAAMLRANHRDSLHMPKAVGILLLPLDVITGLALPSSPASAEAQRALVAEMLNRKSACVSLVCVCLSHLELVMDTPPVFLPCAPVSLLPGVVSLLRTCGGHTPSSSVGPTKVYSYLVGSGKVQRCALEALAAFSACPGAEEKMGEVFAVLIQVLQSPESDPTALQKCYRAMLKWIGLCKDPALLGDELRSDLLSVIRKRVCDVRWDVRDSTLEFLGQLPGLCTAVGAPSSPSVCLCEEVLDCSTTTLLIEALSDPESYVRASAIAALAQTLTHSWQLGAPFTQEQTDVVNSLLDILSTDTEGFARRAVVQFFFTWLSCSSSSSFFLVMSLPSVLAKGSVDLDWEVKVHTLELARLQLEEFLPGCQSSHPALTATAHPPHPHTAAPTTPPAPRAHPYVVGPPQACAGLPPDPPLVVVRTWDLAGGLRRLVEQGVVSALLTALFDWDRPVALKACRLLMTLRNTLGSRPPGGAAATPDAPASVSGVTCELPGRGWGLEVAKACRAKRAEWTGGATEGSPDRAERVAGSDGADGDGSRDAREEGEEEKEGVCDRVGVRMSVCEVLWCLGLEGRQSVLTQSSDHVQNSPLSLLQDILTATHAHSNTHSDQEVIIDCY